MGLFIKTETPFGYLRNSIAFGVSHEKVVVRRSYIAHTQCNWELRNEYNCRTHRPEEQIPHSWSSYQSLGSQCRATNQVHRPKVKREKIQVPKCIRLIDKTSTARSCQHRLLVKLDNRPDPRARESYAFFQHGVTELAGGSAGDWGG